MGNEAKKVNIESILAFVKAQGWCVAVRGIVSLGVVITLLAVYYAFASRRESWRQEVAVTLVANGGECRYPNDRLFSSSDLLSAPVLNRVWTKHGLPGKVKFEDFCMWFSIVSYDRDRPKIDAEYQAKMSKRNITVTELALLQREYEAKLAARAADNRYAIAMCPSVSLTKDESVSLINDIPAEWFAVYSVLNAPTMPSIVRADVLAAYAKRLETGNGRSLELVDALRLYVREISATCDYVRHRLLRGRNVIVDGVDLGAYEARLDLAKSEILRLKNRLLVNGRPEDLENFVSSRLDDMKCETLAVEEKAEAVKQTIELLAEMTGVRRGGPAKEPMSEEGAVTLQADASFFRDFTAMVRRDASQESVQKFATELSQYRKELAEIKARQLYYDQIGDYVKKTRTRTDTKKFEAELVADVTAFTTELVDIGNKVTAFRDRCLLVYRTPDMFYALPSPVAYAKSFSFSVPRLAFGLLALWAFYNLICLVLAWNKHAK